MLTWQQLIIISYSLLSVFVFILGWIQSVRNKNAFGLSTPFQFLGIFVWGDALIIGFFWIFAGLIFLIFNDWIGFLLTVAIFWAVRSMGEIFYWISEQFAVKHRNSPDKLLFHSKLGNDSVWFVYQIFWQCVLVVSIICSIYLANLWIKLI